MNEENTKQVFTRLLDTNEATITIQGALASGELEPLNEAEGIFNYGEFYQTKAEEFRKDEKNIRLAAALDAFAYLTHEQRKRLLVVPTDDSDLAKLVLELRLKDQGGQFDKEGKDPVDRAIAALKEAKASRSEKNLYAVSLAFDEPGLHPSVVVAMAEDRKPVGKSMKDRVSAAVKAAAGPGEVSDHDR